MARRFAALLAAALLGSAPLLGAGGTVVIDEIFYNPSLAEDRTFEFVELAATAGQTIDVGGWQLSGAIEFTLPDGAAIAPGGRIVVCRDRERFRSRFPGESIVSYGNAGGDLGDDGGRIVLRDAGNRVIEVVAYHDREPWPVAADGAGASLQRICPEAPPFRGASWRAAPPTPGRPTADPACPPPAFVPPDIAINEINYHPMRDRDAEEEFIEIVNRGGRTIDLTGWELRGGILFTFPEGFFLTPGSYAVICRNVEVCRDVLGIKEPAGIFQGRLSNRGDLVALHDPSGAVHDAVVYGSKDDWPAAPDGSGFSLERVSPEAPGEDPANWAACSPPVLDAFAEIVARGTGLIPGQRDLALSIEAEGESLIDDVLLEDISNPEAPVVVVDQTFDAGTSGWIMTRDSLHGASAWAPAAGVNGSGALRLISTGACNGRCEREDPVYRVTPALSGSATYRLRLKVKHVRGTARVTAAIDDRLVAIAAPAGYHTGGSRNSVALPAPRPFLTGIGRDPLEPRSSDAPLLTATIRSSGAPAAVFVRSFAGDSSAVDFPMADDGASGDGRANDGIWGVRLPPQEHGTAFLYAVHIRRPDGGETVYPNPHDPSRYFGYYVNDNQPDSKLPVYTIILPKLTLTSPAAVNSHLMCDHYRIGHFAWRGELYPEVGVRFRGFTGCFLQKRHFKVRFLDGRDFEGLHKINLNSLWTDKALLREPLAWEFVRDIGAPASRTEFARVHINGDYYGLYLYLEHPDGRFLERNGLDPDGELFKALMRQPGPGDCDWAPGLYRYASVDQYARYWEEEANQDGDFLPLADFIDGLHDTRGSRAFFEANVDPESVILFQLSQVALHNFDSATKNHFLLSDPATGRWRFLGWDLDLSFGKYFSRDAVGLGRPVGTLNDYMTCPNPELAMDLWFAGEMTLCGFPGNWLIYYFFNGGNTYYHRAYTLRFWDVVQEKYLRERFDPKIAALSQHILEEQAEDLAKWGRYPSNIEPGSNPPPPPNDMASNIEIMKEQIRCHRDQLLGLLPAALRDHPRLRVTEIMAMPDPASAQDGEESLEFLELVNPDAAPIEIGGWSIAGIEYRFPSPTTVGPRGIVVVARDPDAFQRVHGFRPFGPYPGRLENVGEKLYVYEAGAPASYPAVVDYLPYGNGGEWPEMWRGRSIELATWEGAVDNDRGELWRRSERLGGTPGSLPGVTVLFKRGDPDQNGRVQIGDAIFTLGYIFARGAAPACLDGADVNDDGKVNVADAIYLLGYIFSHGPAPAAPFQACGEDAGASLGCLTYPSCN